MSWLLLPITVKIILIQSLQKRFGVTNRYRYCCLVSVKETDYYYKITEDVHKHETRQKNDSKVMKLRLEKTNKSYICMKTKIFNKLPKKASIISWTSFKTVMSEWFKNRVFYSVQQYLACDTSFINFWPLIK